MKPIKIALFGNMNNNQFVLGRYLRDRGYDVDLLINPMTTPALFLPDKDSYDTTYTAWVKEIRWGSERSTIKALLLPSWRRFMKKQFKEYDLVMGNGHAPALFGLLGLNFIYFQYGGDLRNYSSWKLITRKGWRDTIVRSVIGIMFRSGLRKMRASITGGYWHETYLRLGVSEDRLYPVTFPMVYAANAHLPEWYKGTAHLQEFRKTRQANEFLFVSHSRHAWDPAVYKDGVNSKGTDVMLRGFAEFVKRNPSKAKLVLFAYGADVGRSRDLIEELGIVDSIVWIPTLARKEVMAIVGQCDAGVGQMKHIGVGGGVIYEFMSLSVPVIQHLDIKLSGGPQFTEMYPYKHVNDEHELALAFEDVLSNTAKYKAMGKAGAEWYERNIVQRTMDSIEKIIQQSVGKA